MICSRVKKISCTWGGTHSYFKVKIQGFQWIQSLSSNGPILKVEQVRIVFCWLQTSHTLPTSTMSLSRSVQWECPLQLFSSWCSISVVLLIRVLPLEQPLTSHPAFFFSPCHPEEFWARVHVKPDADMAVTLKFYAQLALGDKWVEQWWSIPEVVASILTQIRDFSPSLGERSSWSC